ncbi:MAG: hypothetical protein ABI183_03730 [Polyangiaceae bacterium]
MADPFRQPATTPTASALAKLDAMPADPIRAICAALVAYRRIGDADAPAQRVATASALHMTNLGAASEGLLRTFQKRIFVDEAATTQAHISTRLYFFATYFESGRCILTFERPPRTQNNDNLRARGGCGNFAADYESHCEAIAEWVDDGEVSIVVRDIDTAVALGRFYYRHVIGFKGAARVVSSHPVTLSVIGAIVFLLYLFR